VIDTVHLARRHVKAQSYRLGALATHFRVATPAAHRALGDCCTMEDLFFKIIRGAYDDIDPVVADLTGSATTTVSNRAERWRGLPASLAEMLKRNRRLEIVYVSADGERTTRSIKVRDVTGGSDELCLIADCGLRGALRHFRLDRIIDWKPIGSDSA
jgi:hypothetical protein